MTDCFSFQSTPNELPPFAPFLCELAYTSTAFGTPVLVRTHSNLLCSLSLTIPPLPHDTLNHVLPPSQHSAFPSNREWKSSEGVDST